MPKVNIPFQITYPVKKKTMRNVKWVIEHKGDLVCTGVAYCDDTVSKIDTQNRYSVDIDFVKWNGMDVRDLLEVTDLLEDIEFFCTREAAKLFETKLEEAS